MCDVTDIAVDFSLCGLVVLVIIDVALARRRSCRAGGSRAAQVAGVAWAEVGPGWR